jgi:iron complex transport system ATP-binding protein
VVMVLHDLSLAARYADNLLAMRGGKLIAAGTVHEVVTPDILREVFGVECTVLDDTQSGRPVVIPRSIATI